MNCISISLFVPAMLGLYSKVLFDPVDLHPDITFANAQQGGHFLIAEPLQQKQRE